MTENKKVEEASTPTPTTESSIVMDLMLPFRVLVSPLKSFGQLAQKPTAKGLITLVVLIVTLAATTQYALATRILLTVNEQLISLTATGSFANWFATFFGASVLFIALYWLVSATGLALIGRFFSRKQVKLRSSLVIFGYMFSVIVVLYAVHTIMYLAIPSIPFEAGSWEEAFSDATMSSRMSASWGSSLVYQFGIYFIIVSFVWLVLLGTVAVRAMRDISWGKAFLVSVAGFMLTFVLLGFP